MTERLYWNPSTVVLPRPGGLWRLFQPMARRNLLGTRALLDFVAALAENPRTSELQAVHSRLGDELRVVDASEFTIWENAYQNSDMFDQSADGSLLESMPFTDLMEMMTDMGMVSAEWPPRLDLVKRGFADRFKGSFHEQIATESLFNRTTPTEWWTTQKFADDHRSIKPTPYRFIEEQFLNQYFAEDLPGKTVLEIGSGTGYFTAVMARHAGLTVGLDFNPAYVQTAIDTWKGFTDLCFIVGNITDLDSLAPSLPISRYDRIVLIDTFLFLFDPTYGAALAAQADQIMHNIRRLLNPGGRLLVMDPHPFWLSPWIGAESGPVGFLTEYRSRRLKVTPTIEELTGFLCRTGFRVRRVLEPVIGDGYKAVDPVAYAFMRQFPQWWFWEIEPAPDA